MGKTYLLTGLSNQLGRTEVLGEFENPEEAVEAAKVHWEDEAFAAYYTSRVDEYTTMNGKIDWKSGVLVRVSGRKL